MKLRALPNEIELITCPNPNCHRKIEELITVSDSSTVSAKKYYACPHCFTKLDMTSTQHQNQKEEPPVKPPHKQEKGSSRCAGYLGYLASLPTDAPIPKECLICPRVLDCVMKTSDSQQDETRHGRDLLIHNL